MTKKVLFIVFVVLILVGAAVGVAYSVLPDKDVEPVDTTEIVVDTTTVDTVEMIVDTIPTEDLL